MNTFHLLSTNNWSSHSNLTKSSCLPYLLLWLTILSIPPHPLVLHPEIAELTSSSASPPSSLLSRQQTQTLGRLESVGQMRASPFQSWGHPTVPHPDAGWCFSSLLLVRCFHCSYICHAGWKRTLWCTGSAQEETAAICTWVCLK